MNNNFYFCQKYKTEKKKRPILFFHVPKCAGTTLSVIFSWLFDKQTRIKGPLFENNDKAGKTAFDLFKECPDYNFYNKFNFIYGHLPFEINYMLKKPFLKISLIRDPIERSLSHYNWMLNRGYCKKSDNIKKLFEDNKITKNTITNQFSGKGFTDKSSDKNLDLAYSNLSKKIDLLYKSNDIFKLIKEIISIYDLPDVLFQNQQESVYDEGFHSEVDINIFKENNKMDIELYDMLLKNNVFINKSKVGDEIVGNKFLFSSPTIKIDGKNNVLLKNVQFAELTRKLKESKYKIIKV